MSTQQSSRQYIANPGPTQNILPKICRDDVVIHSGFTNHSSSLAPRLRREEILIFLVLWGKKRKRPKWLPRENRSNPWWLQKGHQGQRGNQGSLRRRQHLRRHLGRDNSASLAGGLCEPHSSRASVCPRKTRRPRSPLSEALLWSKADLKPPFAGEGALQALQFKITSRHALRPTQTASPLARRFHVN